MIYFNTTPKEQNPMVVNVGKIQISKNFKIQLENIIRKHVYNYIDWIKPLTRDLAHFPFYAKKVEKKAYDQICSTTFTSNFVLNREYQGDKPVYLINMPGLAFPFSSDPSKGNEEVKLAIDKYQKMVSLIAQEAFGKNSIISQATIIQRLAAVIGFNQMYSLDPIINKKFIFFISRLRPDKKLPVSAFGFFWKPVWKAKVNFKADLLFDVHDCYRIIKQIDSQIAKRLLKAINKREGDFDFKTPFNLIRETIKNSIATYFLHRHLN